MLQKSKFGIGISGYTNAMDISIETDCLGVSVHQFGDH